MEKPIVKALSIIALVLFGLSFAACGKKQVVEETGDQYVYSTTFNDIKMSLGENDFMSGETLQGNYLYYVVNSVDAEFNFAGISIHKIDLKTQEESVIKLNDDRYERSSWLSKMLFLEDESFYALTQEYDEKAQQSLYYLIKYSKDGNPENSTELNQFLGNNEFVYIEQIFADKEGNIIFYSDQDVIKISSSGKEIGRLSSASWIQSVTMTSDGTVYVSAYGDNGNVEIKPVNADFTGMDSAIPCNAENARLYPGPNGKLIVSTNSSVKVYDPVTKEVTDGFEWLEVDVDRNNVSTISMNDDGSFIYFGFSYDDGKEKIELASITKEVATKDNLKQVITFGCRYLDDDIKNQIKRFNKSSQDYKIKVVVYNEEYEEDEARENAINTDLTSGKLDVIAMDSYTMDRFRKAAALSDLNPYLDGNNGIDRKDYFDNLFRANEVDGKLFAIGPTSTIQTLAIPSKYSNGKSSWTIDDFYNYRNEHMDIPFAESMTRDYALYLMVFSSLDEYIDEEKAECNFLSEDFYKALEFCKSFPKDYTYEDKDEWEEIRNGNVILTQLYLYDLEEIQLYGNLMDSGLALIGFPTSNGSGSLAYFQTSLGIAANSKNKDAAWDFVKSFLLSDYQGKQMYNGFPLLRSAFEESMEKKMEKNTYIDENGVVKEQPVMTWGNGYSTIEIYASTKEEIDLVRNTIEGVTKAGNMDEEVLVIINEEVTAYFEGQKSAEEVANIIQSRVKIYLAETK